MKKLNKNVNLRKENLEAYNAYSCTCSCSSYCEGGYPSSYYNFKALQADVTFGEM
jgi:hypothetical protein